MEIAKWLFWLLVILSIPTVFYLLILIGYGIYQLEDLIRFKKLNKINNENNKKVRNE